STSTSGAASVAVPPVSQLHPPWPAWPWNGRPPERRPAPSVTSIDAGVRSIVAGLPSSLARASILCVPASQNTVGDSVGRAFCDHADHAPPSTRYENSSRSASPLPPRSSVTAGGAALRHRFGSAATAASGSTISLIASVVCTGAAIVAGARSA